MVYLGFRQSNGNRDKYARHPRDPSCCLRPLGIAVLGGRRQNPATFEKGVQRHSQAARRRRSWKEHQ
ncbi:unnamed protein product, partial [Nesidiocoris tenuis]